MRTSGKAKAERILDRICEKGKRKTQEKILTLDFNEKMKQKKLTPSKVAGCRSEKFVI